MSDSSGIQWLIIQGRLAGNGFAAFAAALRPDFPDPLSRPYLDACS